MEGPEQHQYVGQSNQEGEHHFSLERAFFHSCSYIYIHNLAPHT
jgi:hypothetical protein